MLEASSCAAAFGYGELRRSRITGGVFLPGIEADQIKEKTPVQVCRIDLFQGLQIALFPMADQVAVKRAGPSYATLENRKIELRETAGDAAEKQRLAGCLAAAAKCPM